MWNAPWLSYLQINIIVLLVQNLNDLQEMLGKLYEAMKTMNLNINVSNKNE